jgi:hypothetical protein
MGTDAINRARISKLIRAWLSKYNPATSTALKTLIVRQLIPLYPVEVSGLYLATNH